MILHQNKTAAIKNLGLVATFTSFEIFITLASQQSPTHCKR